MKKKEKTKTKKDADSGNCVQLSGRMLIEERRTIEERAAASVYKLGTDTTVAVDGVYGYTHSKVWINRVRLPILHVFS